ncbi:MAG: hypothetical protein COA50_10515 [Flavobacteriaceae bacterium]|nr:MAG: hypothetical protein COA50_10515 [Flavobacteriaceae bacterium]
MRKLFLFISTIGFLISCNTTNDDNLIKIRNGQDFLIFGHFYGECIGEVCVETFKLTDQKIFEDTLDDYSGKKLNFVELESGKFKQVEDLISFFPKQLLNDTKTTFGCPDCTDGGGLFIQYSESGNVKSWRIDQSKDNIPSYLHSFIDKVNEKISLINN